MQRRLGGSLRALDGLRHVVLNARALGFSALQVMLGSGQDYRPMEITDDDSEEYRKMTYGIATYVHLPYVINPCDDAPRRRGFYTKAFKNHCAMASSLSARGVVIHAGFKKDFEEEEALTNLVRFVDKAWDSNWGMKLLIETDAGSKNGSAIGSIENLMWVLERLDYEDVAICLDTAHEFARGRNLWDDETRQRFLRRFGRSIHLVHLNVPDVGVELGSHLDRHNTPFIGREDLEHKGLIRDVTAGFDTILERRSLAIQEEDLLFIKAALE